MRVEEDFHHLLEIKLAAYQKIPWETKLGRASCCSRQTGKS